MPIKRLLAVVVLSAALLWAVSLINQPAQAAPSYKPVAAPPWNTSVRVNDTAPAGPVARSAPAFAATSSMLYAVWQDARNDDGDIYAAQSSDAGQTWGYILRVNHDVPGQLQADPDVAVNVSGTLHVVWEDNGLYYARSTSNGRSWGEAIKISDAIGWALDPAIAVYTNTVCAAWVDLSGVRVDCSIDNGVTWGTDLTAPAVDGLTPDLIVDSSGRPHVVWADNRTTNYDIYYARWSGSAWSAALKLNTDAGSATQQYPSIALNGTALGVGWQDNRSGTQVYARYSANTGGTWSASDVQVSDAGNVIGAPALTTGRNALWATWLVLSGSNYIAYADTGSTAWGTDALITTTTQARQDIAAAGNASYMWAGWAQDNAIWNAARSTTWGTTYQASNAGEATQLYPALGAANNGDLFSVWNDNRSTAGLYAAKSTDGGLTWGTNNFVSGSVDSGQPALAVTDTSTLHVAWRQEDYNYWRIYYNRSTDGGSTWLSARAVVSYMQEHRPQAGASPAYESPEVAVLGNNVYLSWAAYGALYLAKSTDGGSTWGTPTNVFTQVSGSAVQANGKVAVRASDFFGEQVVLAWTNGYTRTCAAFSSDGGSTWLEAKRTCFDAGSATSAQNPAIALASNGGEAVVFWNDNRTGGQQLYRAIWNQNGTLVRNSGQITSAIGPAAFPAALMTYEAPHTIVHAIWQDGRNGDDDIYWARSNDGGLTWQPSVRVNDDSTTMPQQRPVLANNMTYSATKVWAAWQDFRRSNWDIYATTITRTCDVPLTGVGISGTTTALVGQQVMLSSILTPSNASAPIGYEWRNPPNPMQNTSSATYTWSTYGDQVVTLTASSCSAFSKAQTVQVKCSVPITDITFARPDWVVAGSLFTLTAVMTPTSPDLPTNIHWTPEPEAGQGTLQAQYRLLAIDQPVDSILVAVSADNCGGTWGGSAYAQQWITVKDFTPPIWSNFQPSGWISQSVSGYTVPFSVTVQDIGSGLQITSAQVAYSNNGGTVWSAWESLMCTGSNGTPDPQTCSGQHNFEHDSGNSQYIYNCVKTYITDSVGLNSMNVAELRFDVTPPTNPTNVTLRSPDTYAVVPTSTWWTEPVMEASWSGAGDGTYGSGLKDYLYVWSQNPTTVPDETTPGVSYVSAAYVTRTIQIPADGQGWYFHFRARDNVNLLANGAVHKGPYWLDGNPPSTPVVESSIPATHVWSNDNTLTTRWYPATDSGSGVGGYSYLWDTAPTTDPGLFPDPTLTSGGVIYTTSLPVMDGNNHYFHVNACDNAAPIRNCSPALHVGPFRIDTQAPPMEGATTDRLVNDWSNDNSITMNWSHIDPHLASQENRFSYAWSTVSNTLPSSTANLTATTVNISLTTTLADGNSHYFHLRTGDEAGNWSASTFHLGPFRIDTVPPTIPVLVSTSPITGEWTDDNTVRVSWQQSSDGSGFGIEGYSIEWDRSPSTIPDTHVEVGGAGPVITTTSQELPTAFNHYFHVRACDFANNCGPTLHVGPFLIDVTPAVLFASNGSGGPGSEALLTGLAFRPNVTVSLWLTKTNGVYDADEFLTSPQGAFQVMANVPVDAAPGWHGFVAQTGFKKASVPFSVTKGLSITVSPATIYRGTYYTVTVKDIKPSSGGLVIDSDLLTDSLALPVHGNAVKNIKLFAPNDAYSGTHTITVSNRIDNIGVQRGTTMLKVRAVTPLPPPPPPTITLSFDNGIRGWRVGVAGYTGFGFGEPCIVFDNHASVQLPGIWNRDGACVEVRQTLHISPTLPNGFSPVCYSQEKDEFGNPLGPLYYANTLDLWNAVQTVTVQSTGDLAYGTEIKLYDSWHDATLTPVSATEPTPKWDVSCEMPWGPYEICLMGTEYQYNNDGMPNEYSRQALACRPFTLNPPSNFGTKYVLKSTSGVTIPASAAPQMVFGGNTVGWASGPHPQAVNQTFTSTATSPIVVSLPEGGYTYNAIACGYYPKAYQPAPGRGADGLSHPITLTPTVEKGPAALNIVPSRKSFLFDSGQGKVGPFLSLQGISVPGRTDMQTTFTVTFDTRIEYIASVQVTVTSSSGSVLANPVAARTGNPNYWTYSLNLSNLPPGDHRLQVRASGYYTMATGVTSDCGGNVVQPGPIYEMELVMAPPPPWLTSAWATNRAMNWTESNGQYILTGQLTKDLPDVPAFLPIKGDTPEIPFLGKIENHLDASVLVTETFNSWLGSWSAQAGFTSEMAVMCLSAFSGDDCWQVKSLNLTASPASGQVSTAGHASFPANYNAPPINLFSKEFGPWEVYSGIIASYWGVVNVHLSIDFGVLTYADVTPGFGEALGPQVTLTPGANLNGTISLWVDILLGLASAGVDGMPSLCLSWPMTLKADLNDPVDIASAPDVGFKLTGRVWAEVAFWSAEFGPFDIFSYGNCGPAARIFSPASDAPPSVLAAPAVTSDGYGGTMATWVHNTSNDPAHVVGVLYSTYSDGANWTAPESVAGSQTFLVTDPAVAFADYGEVLAVYTSNDPAATAPMTWTDVAENTYSQKMSYSRWNGQSWTAPATIPADDAQGRGRVALAGDPAHQRALAVWLKQNITAGKKRWQMEFSVFNAVNDTWSTPALVAVPPLDSVDAEVSLAFDSQGLATAVWVRQAGVEASSVITSPFTKNDQRTLIIATWDPATPLTWTVNISPAGLPKGALMPSLGFDENDRPVLAYALYQKDRDNVTATGLGNANKLGYAVGSTTNKQVKRLGAQALGWDAHVAPNIRGVEQPRVVALPQQQAAIVFRGFGAPGTPEYAGAAMVATLDLQSLDLVLSEPAAITEGNGWMFAATTTRKASALSGGIRSGLTVVGAYNLANQTVNARMSGAEVANISLAADRVYATQVSIMPDLSVASDDFTVSETLPLSGTLVPFNITVRNLGLARNAQPVTVELIQDLNSTREKVIVTGTVPAQLMFNGQYTFSGLWLAMGGFHQLTARVHPPINDDLDSTNNETTITIGQPATPTGLAGSVNSRDRSLGLSWWPISGPAFEHYRIYRAMGTGTLERLTDTFDPWYTDHAITPGITYRYAVSAVSAAGVESPLSSELALGTRAVYLPLIRR